MKYIPASGKVFDHHEIDNAVKAAKDGWWTEGEFAKRFEKDFASYLGVRYVSLVNSGSSANLLALSALTSSSFGRKAVMPGDEVIAAACAFPTTVNPIIQNRCVPVFVDVDPGTKNPTCEAIEQAITKKTKVIMLAHTLGNPLPLDGIMRLVEKHGLWLIEDCCDALGATYKGKKLSTFGHVSTFSFYPAHQITMGEGGAVVTNNPFIHKALRQFRDWGRDCWCDTGKDNTCRRRFEWQLGDLPKGYDHKYIYSQIGYNLKLTDFQAAIGVAQLQKLPSFVRKRNENFDAYLKFFSRYTKYFILPVTEKTATPSWFGFMLIVKDNAPFTRLELVKYLEEHNIGTRNLFAGNLLRHPAYIGRKDIRVVGSMKNSDTIMNNGFWIGVYPGITPEMQTYVKKTFAGFIRRFQL
ncbi:MAG: lipopolysaccharide biosynthesis protein RfbH [Candidatus Nealsonbacteria bacterium RIFOXYC1_FULL_40_7]|uniref:Lipopolysaccharide biosynthesis protein RfbH n=1 Tax=Candidatus Nealsonbacteria bacterium RIFOXYC1_FULL_40_7 TaxID=1801678 RepID=A0A1G2ET76_9BACT|nr:MAG: lipopolysaccharide biosynthesis protein RfbH [Candidatus Nealsonbacteria bacterium RIFOXYC1_FULL_40_7]